MPVTMVYDLETIPDIEAGRRLMSLEGATEERVYEAMVEKRQGETQNASSFLPHYLQKIITISVVVSTPEWVKVWSLGESNASEADIITRFFEGIERYTPQLVSWNGSGFDLPVLHYRSLLHNIVAPRYWDTGERASEFKWNNYLSRYHQRHIDLMDVLSGYQSRAFAPLAEMAIMLGFPGKMGMHGSEVWQTYQTGNTQSIRDYCETDVLNTYLIYLRFQSIRGMIEGETYELEKQRLRDYLLGSGKSHLLAFEQAWHENENTVECK